MKESDLLKSLLEHTGNLRPAPGASNAELNDLRRAFATSLRQGQSANEVGSTASTLSVSASVREDLEYLATQEFDPGQRTRIARREMAIAGSGVVEWAAGMQAAQTFGPFLDEFGRTHWFDLFIFSKPFRVLRGNQLLLLLPIGTRKKPNEPSLAIPAGTVWIRGPQLTPSAPTDAWVGIRVKGGTLAFPQASTVSNTEITIPSAAVIKLQIDLDPPSAPGPAVGSGSEATNTEANLPESASFAFGPLGVESITTTRASLKVYGNHATLTRSAAAASYEPLLRMILVPMVTDLTTLAIGTVHSTLFQPDGTARIEKSAWGLIVTISKPENLGTASGAGSLLLETASGLTASWFGLSEGEAALGKTFVDVGPLALVVISLHVTHYRGQQTLTLWQETTGDARQASIDVRFPRPFFLSFFSGRNGFDGLNTGAHVNAHLDRPLTVDGSRFPVELDGSVVFLQKGDETRAAVDATAKLPVGFHPLAVALTNALLTITSPARVILNGTLGTEMQLEKGTLVISSGVYSVLPTLPDPYAANFEPRGTRDEPLPGVEFRATVTWASPKQPVLQVALEITDGSVSRLLPEANRGAQEFFSLSRGDSNYWLLDVSSGADQLGVGLSIPLAEGAGPQGSVQIDNLSLQFAGNQLYTMLLPQFQWEAVYNTTNFRTGDVEGFLHPNVGNEPPAVDGLAIDGGPSFVRTATANLIPMAPTPVAVELIRAYTRDNAPSGAVFTLPFGMTASARLQDERYIRRPGLKVLKVPFDGLTGASQISLTAGRESIRQVGVHEALVLEQSFLSGRAVQTRNFAGSTTDNTLGILRASFNNTFASRVPIERIDFSGYGASIFSRWLAAGNPDVGITQVSFDAFNGRTSFERIQMVSLLWPCIGRLVRTIVLERQGSGSVVRWDSGWLSTSPGLFAHKKFKAIHKCVVDGMYDIREIRDTDQIIQLAAGATVQAVYYDADVAFTPVDGISPVQSGQNSSGRVPVRRQLGFVQLVGISPFQNFGTIEVPILTQPQFDELLQRVGPLGGPIDCQLRIGRSKQTMRITEINTARGGSVVPGSPEFAVVVSGTLAVPGPEKWTVVSVDNDDKTVHAIDANRGLPLIQRNGGAYRWADPGDLLHEADAKRDYALFMAHDAQRFLMQRPKIEINSKNISSVVEPKVADPYSMLSSTGLFPRVDQVIKLPAGTELLGGSLKLAVDNITVTGAALGLPGKQLVDVEAWKEVANFAGASLHINSLDDWKIELKKIQQKLEIKGIGELMTIEHDFESIAEDRSKFLEPRILFAPALDAVADILDTLKHMAPAVPGGIGPFQVRPSFDAPTFSLAVDADFNLGTEDGDSVECGMGKAKGNLKVGAELTADLGKADIRGAVFLEISASWQQLIFPLIYAGGHMRFLIRFETTGKPTLELDACAMGSIGGDLIPGLIEVEATVKYGYYIQLQPSLKPGVVVGMEGRATLLSGLVGFKFGVEGRALLSPVLPPRSDKEPAVNIYGRIRVAGTVTLAWAIKKSKSFETDFDVDVDWKLVLFAAKAGFLPLLPVP